ncbi:type I restriction enzyme S subunit [Anoxybacillus vitaminiphilus]|uniref:Type I restriction enzyme S subunit n=1 Tax=Paranoxybacillus vitaminiphilus TaxID=581036 RepID=A0A327Y3W0_9BACL|nr:restriction endonuclease subunit S [Anoxybacillus vitaminiphilus]RAK15434.1 type I restriction enzyme S subunit [Anoxybacillus vitaminiphilus]
MSNWIKVRLGDIVELKRESYQPKPDEILPYIGLEHIGQGTLRLINVGKSNEVTSTKSYFSKGDILFGKLRPYFRKVVRPKFNGVCSTDILVLTSKNPRKFSQTFLFYLMASQEMIDLATASSSGTKMPRADWKVLQNLEVSIPEDFDEQERIGKILEAIDDKIDINTRMNETLEEMAMTLYKHWFVDFGPFQDGEFVESELGMIPKGWRVISSYDLANYINGKAFKTNQLVDNDGLPVIKIAELKSGITNSTKFYNGNVEPKYLLQNGDILFAWSASLGVFIWAKGEAVLNQHIFNVKPNGTLSKSMIYFTLKNIIQEFIEIAASRATTMGHITKQHLIDKKIALPPDELLVKVDEKMSNYYQMILSNMLEVERLIQMRDYLLPRLLSGEIDLSQAEKQVEEVL